MSYCPLCNCRLDYIFDQRNHFCLENKLNLSAIGICNLEEKINRKNWSGFDREGQSLSTSKDILNQVYIYFYFLFLKNELGKIVVFNLSYIRMNSIVYMETRKKILIM